MAQSVDCEQAGRAAEQDFGLPPGLLLAVGQVESGRWNAQAGRIVPWPWTLDNGGKGQQFDSKSDAVAAVRALQAQGRRNIDVGCFQVNLQQHPNAFPALDQAFDPQANAQYAARFLAALHTRLGDWQSSVAAYHSMTPELGEPYRLRVFAAWTGATADDELAQYTTIAGVHVWGPSTPGTGQAAIELRPQGAPHLPRIVTPTH